MDSVKCLFMMCLPLMSDRSVYQLEKYKNSKGSKIKLTLISGVFFIIIQTEGKFYEFTKSFYY